MNLTTITNQILDFFYPNRCPCCDCFIPSNVYVCEECLGSMKDPSESLCKYCGFALEQCKCGYNISYDRAFSCYTYDGIARNGVLSLKDSKNLNFAHHVGNLLSDSIRETLVRYDVVVPVPMCVRKKVRRGYNQAEVISKVIAKNLGIPMDSHALGVVYSKDVQHSLSKRERFKHANDIYFKGTSDVRDKYIILVDDIMTTGSTLSVCSNILHGMGAKSVVVAVATVDLLKTIKGSDVDV